MVLAASAAVACLLVAVAPAAEKAPARAEAAPATRPAKPEAPPSRKGPLRRRDPIRSRWDRFWRRPQMASKHHALVKRAFAPLVAEARKSTVGVFCEGRQVALGTVVDADGHVVTKASELRAPAECRFHDGTTRKATVVGIDKTNDLALLTVQGAHAPPIRWSRTEDPPVGSWVVTPGPDGDPVAVGVVSVRLRRPPTPRRNVPSHGFLGISFGTSASEARIAQVFPNTGAARAGLRPGDLITAVDGTRVRTRTDVQEYLQKAKPGDEVALRVRRDGKERKVTPTLGRWLSGSQLNPQQHMGGSLSERSAGFARILQHDSALRPADCGGPALDSSGRAVGVNIARAGRTESYALPASLVRSLVARLKAATAKTEAKSRPASPAPTTRRARKRRGRRPTAAPAVRDSTGLATRRRRSPEAVRSGAPSPARRG
jgi:serine protease Do